MRTDFDILRSLAKAAETKIILLVLDGLGGLSSSVDDPTELEAAHTPHMDELLRSGVCGLHIPIADGLTPGSGPAHLALFGYDPITYQVGRGTLAALGVHFDLQPGDVAARGNFCTVDDQGRVTDRRAGRIATEVTAEKLNLLRDIKLDGAEVHLTPVMDYRFLLVLRGEGLGAGVRDTDPKTTGKPALRAESKTEDDASNRTARLINDFVHQAADRLKGEDPANMVLLRGFSQRPQWPSLESIYGVKAAALANYPMYRGVSGLVGMDVIEPANFDETLHLLQENWKAYDFFFVHFKSTDSAGEDGDFNRKVALIEELDSKLPKILDLKPDVICITGDHSTPAALAAHSWHPVPLMISSPWCRPDNVRRFCEKDCVLGGLGPRFPATSIMPLLMANALRLEKFGA
ncbi:2,3-bisphosphoglycerate-independent phosphoglycerate mutase [Desulfonatronum parangueonense]